MEFSVLVMKEKRSRRLIRQFCLSKVTSAKIVSSPFSSSVFVAQARKYLIAGKMQSNCF